MLTESEKAQLDQNGFLLLESLIPPDTTAQLRERALALAAAEQETRVKAIHTSRTTARNASGISLPKARSLKKLSNSRRCLRRWRIYSAPIAH